MLCVDSDGYKFSIVFFLLKVVEISDGIEFFFVGRVLGSLEVQNGNFVVFSILFDIQCLFVEGFYFNGRYVFVFLCEGSQVESK